MKHTYETDLKKIAEVNNEVGVNIAICKHCGIIRREYMDGRFHKRTYQRPGEEESKKYLECKREKKVK